MNCRNKDVTALFFFVFYQRSRTLIGQNRAVGGPMRSRFVMQISRPTIDAGLFYYYYYFLKNRLPIQSIRLTDDLHVSTTSSVTWLNYFLGGNFHFNQGKKKKKKGRNFFDRQRNVTRRFGGFVDFFFFYLFFLFLFFFLVTEKNDGAGVEVATVSFCRCRCCGCCCCCCCCCCVVALRIWKVLIRFGRPASCVRRAKVGTADGNYANPQQWRNPKWRPFDDLCFRWYWSSKNPIGCRSPRWPVPAEPPVRRSKSKSRRPIEGDAAATWPRCRMFFFIPPDGLEFLGFWQVKKTTKKICSRRTFFYRIGNFFPLRCLKKKIKNKKLLYLTLVSFSFLDRSVERVNMLWPSELPHHNVFDEKTRPSVKKVKADKKKTVPPTNAEPVYSGANPLFCLFFLSMERQEVRPSKTR